MLAHYIATDAQLCSLGPPCMRDSEDIPELGLFPTVTLLGVFQVGKFLLKFFKCGEMETK